MKNVRYTFMNSPIGSLLLAGDGRRLSRIGFPSGKGFIKPKPEWVLDDAAFEGTKDQLRAYFNGTRQEFDLPLDLEGTDFQRDVWQELIRIPFGMTISYGELARRIGRLSASRAVGAANGANPLPIVIPCHRVIGSNGSLTGFGGGLDTKKWLLTLERAAVGIDEPRLL
ncbi:methylated-DNA--[protein]-cysteine S-methyltransferase [Agrobacterium vitis]|uniref:Methylated-DNA--protein-cysteine methyltransferase n=1 Tax=Agrobacterium vitis TaxID=373 RepID=A0AAE4WC92_AGRVI|nr:methylated-DNA--[protein]-cysteine S-methyltransferase [Agrobacterium vitis]MCF1496638.1 methylated-DNA--[protein]-cysteine S-methyltransferase [Allorhizobium sp. Av2]MCM2439713.1 methylated-DNA--[protein]-cysteine S-methyltransferase [Agrobacterium vitis]MUZ57390.1 methylated-DNA--[protein]-cysteine S-methyltransferase [Agrobacterium vitis]MVA69102.1 methylated-DNA--[protein]-cysteine S-methyltransferase [Agrobacterium vitis]MVA86724.1 methylated-DNA--[protein]-cysteine S-methyltransferase